MFGKKISELYTVQYSSTVTVQLRTSGEKKKNFSVRPARQACFNRLRF